MSRIKRILCVGNRFHRGDSAGFKVYERLLRCDIPHDIEVIDGGLVGLNLLPLVEQADRVVFVDAVVGSAPSSGICILSREEAADCVPTPYGHASGLGFMLRLLPHVCSGNVPDVSVVGIDGDPQPETVVAAADICLALVQGGRHTGAVSPMRISGACS